MQPFRATSDKFARWYVKFGRFLERLKKNTLSGVGIIRVSGKERNLANAFPDRKRGIIVFIWNFF